MTWSAGADGCKAGWVVVLRRRGFAEPVIRVVDAISQVLRSDEAPSFLCIDIPIGLLDEAVPGGRQCDQAARAILRQPRACSVFSPPARRTVQAKGYQQAVRWNRGTSEHRLGISRQCFGILGKIRELDAIMSPSLQKRVIEVHPEVSFYELNDGASITEGKKTTTGLKRRLTLLEHAWGCKLSEIVEKHRRPTVARDDIVDAMAACWTTERVLAGTAIRLPAQPPLDSRGLRMEIVR